jgi:hypothetical protein
MIIDGEFFSGSRNFREPEVMELFKKLVAGLLRRTEVHRQNDAE